MSKKKSGKGEGVSIWEFLSFTVKDFGNPKLPSFGDTFKETLDLFISKFGLVLKSFWISILAFIVVIVVYTILSVLFGWDTTTVFASDTLLFADVVFGVLFGMFYLFSNVLFVNASGLPAKISTKHLLNKSLSDLKGFIPLELLTILLTRLGFILFIVPGVMYSLFSLFAPYVMLFERKGVIESLVLSKRYISGNVMRTFGYLVLLGLFQFAILLFLAFLTTVLMFAPVLSFIMILILLTYVVLAILFFIFYVYVLYSKLSPNVKS